MSKGSVSKESLRAVSPGQIEPGIFLLSARPNHQVAGMRPFASFFLSEKREGIKGMKSDKIKIKMSRAKGKVAFYGPKTR